MSRHFNFLEKAIIGFDRLLKSTLPSSSSPTRPNPASEIVAPPLDENTRVQSIRLMRINHTGEICAQALYKGQALAARNTTLYSHLIKAAHEEHDHLYWCAERLQELNGKTSYLTPFWYLASFSIGVIAGLGGDKTSLSFIAETERQVATHLQGHLRKLSTTDIKSKIILETMLADELQHKQTAIEQGGKQLPFIIISLMRCKATLMCRLAYYI